MIEREPDALELRRRDAFRAVRRDVTNLDPRSDLRTFLAGALASLIHGTGAAAGAAVMRFEESTRDLLILATRRGEVLRRVKTLRANRDGEPLLLGEAAETDRLSTPELRALGDRLGVVPGRVIAAPVAARGRPVVRIEIADPDPDLVPDPATLARYLGDLSSAFELAFLHARLRRERLEARLLQKVGEELARSLDLQSLLNSILELLNQVVAYDAAAIFILDVDELAVVHQSVRGYSEESRSLLHLKVGQGLVGWAAKAGIPQIVGDVKQDTRYFDARGETRSEMVAPLKSGGKILGVFNLESNAPNAYSERDLDLLMTFAGQAAVAIERAELLEEREKKKRLEQEVSIARRIQRTFLPRSSPELRRRGIAGKTLPSLEVSGDYFDFVEHPDGAVVAAVADVSGKGIPAALIMSSLRAAFRFAVARGGDPATWCRDLNEHLVASLRETEFVTGIFGILSADQTRFRYCNAGHNPPLLLRADGRVEWLEIGGPLLGAFPNLTYEGGEVSLGPGDRLLLYTDGLTEAFDAEEREFGQDQLVEAVRRHRDLGAYDLCLAVIRDVRRFVGGAPPDDLTIAALSGPAPREDAP